MKQKKQIILALDVSTYDDAMHMVEKFSGHIDIFKVGSELFTSAGPKVIEEIHSMDRGVFLDLKFHDIPNTVARSAVAVAQMGVFMFNVHTMGGFQMMQHATQTLQKVCLERNIQRPKLIGVTILTSLDQTALRDELGVGLRMSAQVRHLAGLARRAGLDGVVASPEEAEAIRSRFEKDFLIVTPGIRPSWAKANDQKRTATPQEALRMGADYIVMGRAILSQPDPMSTLKRIEDEIAGV